MLQSGSIPPGQIDPYLQMMLNLGARYGLGQQQGPAPGGVPVPAQNPMMGAQNPVPPTQNPPPQAQDTHTLLQQLLHSYLQIMTNNAAAQQTNLQQQVPWNIYAGAFNRPPGQ